MPSSKFIAALLSVLLATEARAELREFRFYVENDFFNPITDQTDRYYTQGIRFEWLNGPKGLDDQLLPGITHSDWCSLICGKGHRKGPDQVSVESGYAFGQNMYTPADITISVPQPYDRPWAGMIYVSRIARIRYRDESLQLQRQDQIETSFGIVSPVSLAGETQILWHEIWGFEEPAGWDNQLRNEPILQLRYETAVRWQPKRHFDVIPRIRGNLGNALTSLEAEVTERFGWNLAGFGVPQIPAPPPALASALFPQVNASAGVKWIQGANVFLRGALKAVAHSIMLDGNTFADNDIRVRRKPLVPEFAAGTELHVLSRLRVTFQFIHRGSEFVSLGRNAPAQQFGAITIAWVADNH